jgi:hypothetical protein
MAAGINDGTPVAISTLYERDYERNLRVFAQQKASKTRSWCVERNAPYMHLWDNVATIDETDGTNGVLTKAAGAGTPEQAVTVARRRTTPSFFHMGHLVDPSEVAQVCQDPTSRIVELQGYAFGRKLDRDFFTAMFGNITTEAAATVALPAGSKLGSATQAFDFTFILSLAESFMSSEIAPEVDKVVFIRPNAAKKMLDMTEATSSDYVNAKALATNGFVEKWMGFTWIVTTMLPNITGSQYKYAACTREAMGLHWTEPLTSRVAERPDKSFNWSIYSKCAYGLTRLEEACVRELTVLES